ncbi:MAG: NERD domain-containing protein [Campylobacterota bacterium]|nr:NERD domain-containing protein [Campylobacterota bacterium]
MIDPAALFGQIFSSLWYLLPIIIIVTIIKSPWFKGKVGEGLVNVATKLRLDGEVYTNIKDVTLRLNDGSTTQIDHIIVSPFGIYVIETKNMKGWIYGSESQKQWIQNIYGKKHRFQNPLHQNYRHIKALQELLEFEANIHSIVVFTGESTFKTKMPPNVFIGGKYIGYIQSFTERVFSEDDVRKIIGTIESGKIAKSFKTNREHVQSLKERHSVKNNYRNDPKITCKKCGSAMMERTNKKTGDVFLGCSNYPKCRNTEQV